MKVDWISTDYAGFTVKIIDYSTNEIKDVVFSGEIMHEDEYSVTVRWDNPATLEK